MYKKGQNILKLNFRFSKKITLSIIALFVVLSISSKTHIKGIVKDAKTNETLPGVSVSVKNTELGTVSDFDGNYELILSPGKYTIMATYISYAAYEQTDIEVKNGENINFDILMKESPQTLGEVVVLGAKRLTTELSLMKELRESNSVMSGISSQQITKNQDRDASEVIKRIPGISIMDNKFVVARGLGQRYNNVWLNNSATPGSEADSRAFSFDMVPSGQIENIVIVKSPQPELPADFSGGFVKISTKGIPNENSMELSYTTGINTQTQFKDFKYSKGSSTDFLGFDNGFRSLADFMPFRLNEQPSEVIDKASKSGFNNNWDIMTRKAIPDQRFTFVLNRRIQSESGKIWGLTGALNYSYVSRTYLDVKNVQYGVYNNIQDHPEPDNEYLDDQYNISARIGAMFNTAFIINNNHRIEFRNSFNQLGQDRYTFRTGTDFTSGREKGQEKQEYLYSSRSIYSGQFSGKHTISALGNLDWTAGFSYTNKNQPDRRIINRTEYAGLEGDPKNGQLFISQADIERNFIKLDEYIYNMGVNYNRDFNLNPELTTTLKAGLYGEYKTRKYNTRDFSYLFNESNFPYEFSFGDVVKDILIPENFGAGKLYITETTNNVDSYKGKNTLLAGYLAVSIPYKSFNIYAGARIEHNKMILTNYKSTVGFTTKDTEYKTTDVFPSVNISYNLNKDNLLRFAYGMSVNRPEFREVSPASYYDFDIFNRIEGNPDLKSSYIHNFDVRYEFYPSPSELISVALFYKNFKDPIEWTYHNTGGGSRIYTFENALSANNYGIELDIKKSLDFISLRNLSVVINASLISSKVKFPDNSIETERALQGQSPYLVNAGLFYENDKLQLTAGLMYNIVGKRLVGIGMKSKGGGSTINDDVPDMYEMPRNVFDFTVSKKFGNHFEISAAIKDILAQNIVYKQFPKFNDSNGTEHEREQITKEYEPGQNITISAKFKF